MRPARVDLKQSHTGASHASLSIEVIAATPAMPARDESRSKPSALRQQGAVGELDVLAPELACG
jgi:hypothetical protein